MQYKIKKTRNKRNKLKYLKTIFLNNLVMLKMNVKDRNNMNKIQKIK